jgi:hypothetical protein
MASHIAMLSFDTLDLSEKERLRGYVIMSFNKVP